MPLVEDIESAFASKATSIGAGELAKITMQTSDFTKFHGL